MNKQRKAKLNEITIWYKFRPQLNMWFSKDKHKTYLCKLSDETWYGGYWFNTGYFAFLQLKYFAIHIMFSWWKIKL
jgi:hypothetical protein